LIRRVLLLLLVLCCRVGAQVPEPNLLGRLKPFLPPGSITRGFTYIDATERAEYVFEYTVGAEQSRVILVQKENPRLYLLVPTMDEDQVGGGSEAIHNGYAELLMEDKDQHLHKVFDSHEAFGERLLNHTDIGFADLTGKGRKDMVVATQFSTPAGGLSSELFVFSWNGTEYQQVIREKQGGEYVYTLRLVPTRAGAAPDIFVVRQSGDDATRCWWWDYAYDRGTLSRRQWGGPIPGRCWIAQVAPGHTWRVIVARWVPMDTPNGKFLDKSEVTFYSRAGEELAAAEHYWTFRDPFELTREVPRDQPIPDDLWPWYFSRHLIDHLPARHDIQGEVDYPTFPEKARARCAMNFQLNGKTYTALAYIMWKVSIVGDANPAIDQYLQKLPWPHQVYDKIPCANLQAVPQVQIKVMSPAGNNYKDLWTSPQFPEGERFDGFEVEGDALYARLAVHGEERRVPLPFQR
jgi:hypothetical protein